MIAFGVSEYAFRRFSTTRMIIDAVIAFASVSLSSTPHSRHEAYAPQQLPTTNSLNSNALYSAEANTFRFSMAASRKSESTFTQQAHHYASHTSSATQSATLSRPSVYFYLATRHGKKSCSTPFNCKCRRLVSKRYASRRRCYNFTFSISLPQTSTIK